MPQKRTSKELKALVTLRKQIKALKTTPDNFRDMEPHTPKWQAFGKAMGHAFSKQMDRWAHGEVIYIGKELNEKEKRCFSSSCTYTRYPGRKPNSFNEFVELIEWIEKRGSSFAYLRVPAGVVASLNVLLSYFDCNCRIRGKLKADSP